MSVISMKQLLEQVFISDTRQEDGTLKWLLISSLKETVSILSIFRRQLKSGRGLCSCIKLHQRRRRNPFRRYKEAGSGINQRRG